MSGTMDAEIAADLRLYLSYVERCADILAERGYRVSVPRVIRSPSYYGMPQSAICIISKDSHL